MNLPLMIILLVGLVASATICVLLRDLLKACIALAVVSAIEAVIMFIMGANLAAVFELSVCAGLITVIFVSAISMTKLRTREEIAELEKKRLKRFVFLPILLILLLTGAMILLWPRLDGLIPFVPPAADSLGEPDIFWNKRQSDLLGQIIIILAGVYGVLIFFRERGTK